MFRFVSTLCALAASFSVIANTQDVIVSYPESCPAIFHQTMKKLHSNQMLNLCEVTAGKPVLLINTASHCGFTKQFGGLEEIHKKYAEKGLVVMGVASNSFDQAAKTEEEAAEICFKNFGVTFTMLAQVPVKGEEAHPLFKEVARQDTAPKWNFYKYFINTKGEVVKSHSSMRMPSDKNIEKLLSGEL